MRPAHVLRDLAHRCRNRLSPADRRDYPRVRERLERRNRELASDAPSVVFDLRHPLADREKGRYVYGLVRELLEGGYRAYLADEFWFLSSFHRKAHKRLLLEERVGLATPSEPGTVDLLVTDRRRALFGARARRVLRLDYRSRLHAGPPAPPGLLRFPFRPHPNFHARRDPSVPWPDLADDDRPIRVSFLGHWRHRDYDNGTELAEFGVHARGALVRLLRERFAGRFHQVSAGHPFPRQGEPASLVLTDDPDLPRLDGYMRLLRASDFFIALPGTGFPMCHNLVESLLLGCIPIVERPALCDLPLVPGESCFAFDGPGSLVRAIESCLALGHGEVARLRSALRPIVERHLAPGAFARRLNELGETVRAISLHWFERA